jgi:hypothetical protein
MSDPYNHFLNPAPMPARPIKMVFELWLAPQMPTGNPLGAMTFPCIDHQDFDYARIGRLIGDLFSRGRCQILVANDWVDPLSFEIIKNEILANPPYANAPISSVAFADFRSAVSRYSNRHVNGIIDVRSSQKWQKLVSKRPPLDTIFTPQSLLFCVNFAGVDDRTSWLLCAQDSLRNSPLDGLARAFEGRPAASKPSGDQGVLPVWALNELSDIFKVPFEAKARLEFDRGGW